MITKFTTTLKVTALAFAAVLFSTATKAQSGGHDSQAWHFGIGVEPGIPVGSIHDYYKFALGGSARIQKDLSGNVSLTLTSGYTNFFGSKFTTRIVTPNSSTTISGKADNFGIVPLKVGLKLFFAPHAYISGEAGAGFETTENAYGEKNTKLILSPGIGYAVSGSGLDLSLRYDNFSGQGDNYGLVALRVAYGFKL